MKIAAALILLLLLSINAYTQSIKLSDFNSKNNSKSVYKNTLEKTEDFELYKPIMMFWPLNPMLVVENSKVYFGLTKEVNVILPGAKVKMGFEYSYIFREERNNHIRAFADYIIPLLARDFAAILMNVGGGYFTDTKKAGLFPQISFGLLAGFGDFIGINVYIKARETFMLKSEESNIFDLSLGVGAAFYPF
ncbi:MAG: hypothetical protein WC644_07385 [Ignavibacteria bacterium]